MTNKMTPQKTHVFVLNPDANGGEQILLTTTIEPNGGEPFPTQELNLNSYGNCVTFHMSLSPFTPDNLRKLANELESFLNLNM